MTALFADIKGSTELMEDLDPEEARAIIDPALKLMIDAVHRYDGYVVQSTGDGIFALFGAPLAHEDHPQRALYAALRMQEEMRRYSAKVARGGGIPIEARVGVNTGEVVVRSIATGGAKTEYTPIGHTTNLAARMQALAPTGSIAISEHTRKSGRGIFRAQAARTNQGQGRQRAGQCLRSDRTGAAADALAARGWARLDEVRRAASARWRRSSARATSPRRGMGRSSPRWRSRASASRDCTSSSRRVSQSGWMVLETFSVSHGKASAYLPVIDLLHGYFEIEAEDDTRKRREKVTGRVVDARPRRLEDALPYLFACWASPRAPILWRRWTGRLRSGARWRRSSEFCCARASISR